MNKYSPIVVFIVLPLTSALGCAKSNAPSEDDSARVEALPVDTEIASPAVRQRRVVNLTDTAAARFKEILATEPTKHVRVAVKHGGSTGFMYALKIDDLIKDSDFVDRSHGFTVIVDPKSSLYLEGATIDWLTQPDGSAGFKFDNPNALKQ